MFLASLCDLKGVVRKIQLFGRGVYLLNGNILWILPDALLFQTKIEKKRESNHKILSRFVLIMHIECAFDPENLIVPVVESGMRKSVNREDKLLIQE